MNRHTPIYLLLAVLLSLIANSCKDSPPPKSIVAISRLPKTIEMATLRSSTGKEVTFGYLAPNARAELMGMSFPFRADESYEFSWQLDGETTTRTFTVDEAQAERISQKVKITITEDGEVKLSP